MCLADQVEGPYREFLLKQLRVHLPGCKVYAFGSRVRGDAHRYSDLDLGIDSGGVIDLGKLAALNEIFAESEIPYKIDIVDMNNVDSDFREHIIKTGEMWLD